MSVSKIDQPIYLIDDDKMITEGFSQNLSRFYDLKCFNSAKDALVTLDNDRSPKVIISDLQMPDLDGLSFIEKLREKNKDTKIIVASGYVQKQDALRAVNLGVFAFLEKPFTMNQLQEVVSKAMESFIAEEKKNSLEKQIHSLIDLYSQLGEQYFDRIVMLENNAFDLNLKLISARKDLLQYTNGIYRERLLENEIEKTKNRISSVAKILTRKSYGKLSR